jgi:hypothetical protein
MQGFPNTASNARQAIDEQDLDFVPKHNRRVRKAWKQTIRCAYEQESRQCHRMMPDARRAPGRPKPESCYKYEAAGPLEWAREHRTGRTGISWFDFQKGFTAEVFDNSKSPLARFEGLGSIFRVRGGGRLKNCLSH